MIENETTILINNKYIMDVIIGKGHFGCVYKGHHKKTREHVAIKLEHSNSPIKLLKNETTILNYLYNNGCLNVPQVHWYGIFKNSCCLVMTLYDYSLYDYNKSKELSIEQIQKIILKSIDIIENIHNSYIIHRDIKPQNIMIKNNDLFIIDFGFSTFYIDDNKNHLPIKTYNGIENGNIIGTPKYISLNIHNGITPSRRDDLISLGYIFIFLFCKQLPWDALPMFDNINNYDEIHILHPKNQYIKHFKKLESIENIEQNSKNKLLFQTIIQYIKYCYSLNYDDEPNYYSIKQLFMKTIDKISS